MTLLYMCKHWGTLCKLLHGNQLCSLCVRRRAEVVCIRHYSLSSSCVIHKPVEEETSAQHCGVGPLAQHLTEGTISRQDSCSPRTSEGVTLQIYYKQEHYWDISQLESFQKEHTFKAFVQMWRHILPLHLDFG